MTTTGTITIIGGGLAGCEAAWQAVQRGCNVRIFEMKPDKYSEAHHSNNLAELVCSNSFRAAGRTSAVGLLKEEMQRCNSLFMESALATEVPAGKALAVDRDRFSKKITRVLQDHPLVEIVREEVVALPSTTAQPTIIATGPLTSAPLTEALGELTGQRLAFYDAIAPIIYTESLDMNVVYRKSRYDDGPGDYLNCPMDQKTYLHFIDELGQADYVPLKDFENAKYFEGCLPVEVICSRGADTLRFGPMKPVGLADPRTGEDPYAVVQLRMENLEETTCNMVGFQTKLTYAEQKRIFRLIPGMEQAEFARLGSIHRNTFVRSPELLEGTLQFRARKNLLLAGQLSGVEGYVESAAMGMLAGINAARIVLGQSPVIPPEDTALGALIHHLTTESPNFQPSNVNFGLFPPLKKKIKKRFRGEVRAEQAEVSLQNWLKTEAILVD